MDSTIRVRRATVADIPAVGCFLAGLSALTAYRRFHAGVGGRADRLATRLLAERPDRLAWIAEASDADDLPVVVALGNAAVEPDGTLEVAAVVADAWQGRGIGTRLTEAALFAAPSLAATRVRFVVLADNRRLVSALRRGFPEGSLSYDGSSGEILAPLYLPGSPAAGPMPGDSSTSATDRRGVMAPATVP